MGSTRRWREMAPISDLRPLFSAYCRAVCLVVDRRIARQPAWRREIGCLQKSPFGGRSLEKLANGEAAFQSLFITGWDTPMNGVSLFLPTLCQVEFA